MIIKFDKFLNESFDIKKDIIIVTDKPEELNKIIDDLKRWGYKYYESSDLDEEDLKAPANYPISIIIYRNNLNGYYLELFYDEENFKEEYNIYYDLNDFYLDVKGVNFIKNKGISKPNYNPKKFINNLNEQFDIKKDIAINIDTVNDYKRLKRYLDEWYYKSSEFQIDEEDLEEDYNYPILIVFYDLFKSEYMIYFDDPYGEQLEEGESEKYYNTYKSVDEFLLDREAVNYIRNKGVAVPNYKPKKRSI